MFDILGSQCECKSNIVKPLVELLVGFEWTNTTLITI